MTYSKSKTVIKAALHFCGALTAALSAVWVVLPADVPVSMADWKVIIVPLALAAWRGIENYRKNSGTDGKPAWEWGALLPFCLVVSAATILAAGCVTSNLHTREVKADGATFDKTFTAVSVALPGSKIAESVHSLSIKGLNDISVGQNAAGLDNTLPMETINKLIDRLPVAVPVP